MNEENLQLNILELADNQSFILWAKQNTNADKWEQWLESHPDQKVKVEEAKLIVQTLQFNNPKIVIDKSKLWDRIEASTDAKDITLNQSTTKVRTLWRRSFIGIAASFAVLIAAVFLINNDVEVMTPLGQNIVYTLPDQSNVYLNAESEMAFDKRSFDKKRELKLKGEAFFEVEKGSQFTVVTDNGNVQVLGTQFNVYSRGNSFKVKCTEGKVEITSKGQKQILTAGDVVQLSGGQLESIPFQAKIDWRQKSHSFNNTSLDEVFNEIERQFDVNINTHDNILNKDFTGVIETKDLEKALYMVSWSMGLNYQITDKGVEISQK